MSNIAIVLLTRKPDNIWLNFLNTFNNYKIKNDIIKKNIKLRR